MNASINFGLRGTFESNAQSDRALLPARSVSLGALLGAVLFTALTAQAQIIYTNIADLTFNNSSGTNIALNMGTGGGLGSAVYGAGPMTTDFRINASGTLGALFVADNFGGQMITDFQNNPLATNDLIGAGSTWITSRSFNPPGGGTILIGARFNGGAGTNYGWIRIIDNNDNTFTLTDFAYEQSGGSIQAGAVSAIPEPAATAALCGTLAIAALCWRRRQNGIAA